MRMNAAPTTPISCLNTEANNACLAFPMAKNAVFTVKAVPMKMNDSAIILNILGPISSIAGLALNTLSTGVAKISRSTKQTSMNVVMDSHVTLKV